MPARLRTLHALALFAALLLALLPASGRLWQSLDSLPAGSGPMCSSDASPAKGSDAAHSPASAHECDYCPLLAGLLLLAGTLLGLFCLPRQRLLPARRPAPAQPARLTGLGARGPPPCVP